MPAAFDCKWTLHLLDRDDGLADILGARGLETTCWDCIDLL